MLIKYFLKMNPFSQSGFPRFKSIDSQKYSPENILKLRKLLQDRIELLKNLTNEANNLYFNKNGEKKFLS